MVRELIYTHLTHQIDTYNPDENFYFNQTKMILTELFQ